MHEDVEDDDEDVVLDRQALIDQSNPSNGSSNAGPMLLGINRFNIKVYDDPIKVSRAKSILLAATCVSIVSDKWIRRSMDAGYASERLGYDRWFTGPLISLSRATDAN